jgi:hypothetical protein
MDIKTAIDILALEAFPTEDYEPIALTSLTAYSIFWLSEWGIPTSFETLAVLNFKLFPAKFAMVGWPQFPDFNRTNRSVLQMRPKYRNLATSITKKGVFLNENGIKEAQALVARIGSPTSRGGSPDRQEVAIPSVRGPNRARTIHPEDQIAKLKSSKLYQLYQGGRWTEAEAIDLVNFLEVYDHTPSKEKVRRLSDYQQAAEKLDDHHVLEFIDKVASTFHGYLHRQPRGAR